jgi:hypothetical protein
MTARTFFSVTTSVVVLASTATTGVVTITSSTSSVRSFFGFRGIVHLYSAKRDLRTPGMPV